MILILGNNMKLEIEFKIDGKMLSCNFSQLPDFFRSIGIWKISSSGKFVVWFVATLIPIRPRRMHWKPKECLKVL